MGVDGDAESSKMTRSRKTRPKKTESLKMTRPKKRKIGEDAAVDGENAVAAAVDGDHADTEAVDTDAAVDGDAESSKLTRLKKRKIDAAVADAESSKVTRPNKFKSLELKLLTQSEVIKKVIRFPEFI